MPPVLNVCSKGVGAPVIGSGGPIPVFPDTCCHIPPTKAVNSLFGVLKVSSPSARGYGVRRYAASASWIGS
jgi:hypothetical protein